MNKRQLGPSDLNLTTIGIGTWAIGGGDWKFGWGQQDESEAIVAIVAGIRAGINWIDTAAVYGNGRSEELVGKALRELGSANRPIVATKCGRIIQDDGSVVGRLTPASVRAECDASLRRLGVDCIDLYQIHWPDPDGDIEAAWTTLVELKQAGKIRELGVSNHNVAQMERLERIHKITSLQPPYSLLARGIEDEILPYCGQHQIGVVCYSPMAKGLLTGAFTRERAQNLPADDHRSRDPKFQEPQLSEHLALVERLKAIAAAGNHSVAELAIAWTLRRPEVTSAIVGARRPDQILSLLGASDWHGPDLAEI
ncbi:MAG: aldo/keto reductase [Planctomycetales bacterium]|nr:aldo/keto reductase [Planctomycetales bacterium]